MQPEGDDAGDQRALHPQRPDEDTRREQVGATQEIGQAIVNQYELHKHRRATKEEEVTLIETAQ